MSDPDSSADVALIPDEVTGLLDSMSPTFEAHLKQAAPAALYHYTRQQGLLGILENSRLHATKVQYMNDSTEFELALYVVQNCIDDRRKTETDPERLEKLNTLLRKERRSISGVNIFAACFCTDGDYLGQWRGYANGGPGFALGLDTGMLVEVTGEKHFRLGKCIYNALTRANIVNEILDHCLSLPLTVCAAELEKRICAVGAFFKDRAFEDEDEWRLVSPVTSIIDEEVEFRPGRSMIVPYYSIPIDLERRGAVHRVVVGPGPHPSLSADSIKMLLRHNRIWADSAMPFQSMTPEVTPSKIPYRDW